MNICTHLRAFPCNGFPGVELVVKTYMCFKAMYMLQNYAPKLLQAAI